MESPSSPGTGDLGVGRSPVRTHPTSDTHNRPHPPPEPARPVHPPNPPGPHTFRPPYPTTPGPTTPDHTPTSERHERHQGQHGEDERPVLQPLRQCERELVGLLHHPRHQGVDLGVDAQVVEDDTPVVETSLTRPELVRPPRGGVKAPRGPLAPCAEVLPCRTPQGVSVGLPSPTVYGNCLRDRTSPEEKIKRVSVEVCGSRSVLFHRGVVGLRGVVGHGLGTEGRVSLRAGVERCRGERSQAQVLGGRGSHWESGRWTWTPRSVVRVGKNRRWVGSGSRRDRPPHRRESRSLDW